MFRDITSLFLVVAIMSANLGRYIAYAGFELNKKYIATTLCENRDKPEMHCNGQCYLAKKLKQAAEKEKKQEQEAKKNNFQEAFMTDKCTLVLVEPPVLEHVSAELPFTLPTRNIPFFQPPRI